MQEITNEKDFMKFVYEFHETMLNQQLTLVYEGEINQQLVKALTTMAEKKLDKADENLIVKKRVYHVMVECLQNIDKHSDNHETGEPLVPGSGIVMVGKNKDHHFIATGNIISNERIVELRSLLDAINNLNKEELKAMYKKQIRESRISDKGGAGLGFIDIAKKTGQKIIYHFEPVNDVTSFFILKIKVLRDN